MGTNSSSDEGSEPASAVPSPVLLGTNQSGMRAQNERLVLTMVRRKGPLAKAEIARMTGLSAQTVSVIMRALETDGLLEKGEPVRGRVGQPSVPMALAAEGALFYGLKIGRRSTDLILTDFLGNVLNRASTTYSHPTPDTTTAFATEAFARIQRAIGPKRRARVSGLGIAMPFQLWDWASALGVDQIEMNAWLRRDLQKDLSEALHQPVYMQNDATAACGAELVFGTGEAPANFLYLYIGFFVGGGVVLNRQLYGGPNGNAGAMGSMPVPGPEGRMVQLLDIASLAVLERSILDAGQSAAHLWQDPSGWDVDEDLVARWVDASARGIAHAVTSGTSLLDCPTVIIEGWLPESIKTALVQRTQHALDQINYSGVNRPEILPGDVGPDARALGAASLPLSRRYLIDSADKLG